MRVSVFGLGYVGLITSLGLAEQGHGVVGVDIAEDKVNRLNRGESPLSEAGVQDRLNREAINNRFRATLNTSEAIAESSVSLICVGTPSGRDGEHQLNAVENVSRQIGRALRDHGSPHAVVLRSTVLPGTSESVTRWLEASSGRTVGQDLTYVYQPEFMREGSAFQDFYDPPFTVFGPDKREARDLVDRLYPDVEGRRFALGVREAELLKYACNAYHALKIGFANEIGRISAEKDVDASNVMEVLSRDKKLNISEKYLNPGFAFGGSCLTKDLKALCAHGTDRGVHLPILENVLPSNDRHLDFAAERIRSMETGSLGVVGLTFKEGTDDLRESPMVKLCARLKDELDRLTIFDPRLVDADLHGANRLFVEQQFPDFDDHLTGKIEDLVERADVCLLGPAAAGYREALDGIAEEEVTVLDLAGVYVDGDVPGRWDYRGICW